MLSPVRHSLKDLIKSPISGGKSSAEYFKTKKFIADGLTKENLKSIQFLCARYIPRSFELTSGFKLLEYIEDYIDENDVTFLVEILYLIQRYDLIKVIPGICNRSDSVKNWTGLCIFRNQRYRNFAVWLEPQLTEGDWIQFKSHCKRLANCPGIDRAGSVIDILQKLEELDLVCDDDFSVLLMILREIKASGPYQELEKIQNMKNKNDVPGLVGNSASGDELRNEPTLKETLKPEHEMSDQNGIFKNAEMKQPGSEISPVSTSTHNSKQVTIGTLKSTPHHSDLQSVLHKQDLPSTSKSNEGVNKQQVETLLSDVKHSTIIAEDASVENIKANQNLGAHNAGVKDTHHTPDRGKSHEKSAEDSEVKSSLEKNVENEVKAASITGQVAEFSNTLAIIINNKDFCQFGLVERACRKPKGLPLPHFPISNRYWSDIDIDGMSSTLKRVGVDVCIYDNLSSSSIRNLLKEIARGTVKCGKHRNLRQYDRFLLFILSHGDSNNFYGVDGFKVSFSEVLEKFYAENCPILANKPKIVFPIWCRVSNLAPENDIQYLELKKRIDEENNLMVIWPTQYGFKSNRLPNKGTLFLFHLFKGIKAYHQEKDLLEIMEAVSISLGEEEQCQVPECLGHLEAEFFFKLMDRCCFDDTTMDGKENAGTIGKTQSE